MKIKRALKFIAASELNVTDIVDGKIDIWGDLQPNTQYYSSKVIYRDSDCISQYIGINDNTVTYLLTGYNGSSVSQVEQRGAVNIASSSYSNFDYFRISFKKEYLGKFIETDVREINPYYNDSLSFNLEREQGEMFYRKSIEGDFDLLDSDYDWIESKDIETKFTIRVAQDLQMNDTGISMKFTKMDCSFDADHKKCTVKFSENDDYTKILENKDKEFDLLKCGISTHELRGTERAILQIYFVGDSVVNNIIGNTMFKTDCSPCYSTDNLVSEKFVYGSLCLNKGCVKLRGNKWKANYIGGLVSTQISLADGVTFNFYDEKSNSPVYIQMILSKLEEGGLDYNHRDKFRDRYMIREVGTNNILYQHDYIYNGHTADWSIDQYTMWYDRYYKSANKVVNVSDDEDEIYFDWQIHTGVYRYVSNNKDEQFTRYTPAENYIPMPTGYKYVIFKQDDYLDANVTINADTQIDYTDIGKSYDGSYFVEVGLTEMYYQMNKLNSSVCTCWIQADYNTERSDFNVDRKYFQNFALSDVINVLLKKMGTSFSFQANSEYSKFLYGASMISQRVNEHFITQISNIKISEVGNGNSLASKANISFSQLMNALKNIYGLYWFVEGGKLKIEHYYYFDHGHDYSNERGTSGSIVINNYLLNKNYSYCTNKWSYEKENIAEETTFNFATESSDCFVGSIKPRTEFANKGNTDAITINGFDADLDYISAFVSDVNKDGMMLIGCVEVTGTENYYKIPIVQIQYNQYKTFKVNNGYLSFSFLLPTYHLYDLPCRYADVNGVMTKAKGISRNKMQEVVCHNCYTGVSTAGLFYTELGGGQIEKLNINVSSRTGNLKLSFKNIEL